MKNILVIAPHPDDETLGCGGMIFKNVEKGHNIFWLIVTCIKKEAGFSETRVNERAKEIDTVANLYQFKDFFTLDFITSQLDDTKQGMLIQKIANIIDKVNATDVYLPFLGDVHSDHSVVYKASISASKSFRHRSVKRLLCYETLSETNFNPAPALQGGGYFPNIYEDITDTLDKKINAMKIYKSEWSEHPFPRSEESLKALAILRGSECGCKFAESFMLLKEICD